MTPHLHKHSNRVEYVPEILGLLISPTMYIWLFRLRGRVWLDGVSYQHVVPADADAPD